MGTTREKDGRMQPAEPVDDPRGRYSPPKLIEWGRLRDLTGGNLLGGQDDGVLGTENI